MIVFQGIGQARNLSTLDSDRLAFHSSRVSKTGPHARLLSLALSYSNDDHGGSNSSSNNHNSINNNNSNNDNSSEQ